MMKLMFSHSLIVLLSITVLTLHSCKPQVKQSSVLQSITFERQLIERLDKVKEGEVIELPEGTFHLTTPLVLNHVKNITIAGAGIDKTILCFDTLQDTMIGFNIHADGIVLQNFTIKDTKGDCIKINDAMNVSIRNIKAGNIYPTARFVSPNAIHTINCTNLIVENCETIGASDAGICASQCKNIVIRRNNTHHNNAGITLINTTDADVYENTISNNVSGLWVLDLPYLIVKNGLRTRVHHNKIFDNNTPNLAVAGQISKFLPAGTGITLLATNHCEVFNNEIRYHRSASTLILNYQTLQLPFDDPQYDPYCGGIDIHDNQIEKGTMSIDTTALMGKVLVRLFSNKVPDIICQSNTNPAYYNNDGSLKADEQICIRNNLKTHIGSFHGIGDSKLANMDSTQFNCTLTPLKEIKINQ